MVNLTTAELSVLGNEILSRTFGSMAALIKLIVFWVALSGSLILSILAILVSILILAFICTLPFVPFIVHKAAKRQESMAKDAHAARERQQQIDLEAGRQNTEMSAVNRPNTNAVARDVDVEGNAVDRENGEAVTRGVDTENTSLQGPKVEGKDAEKSATEESEEKPNGNEAKEESSEQSTLGQEREAPIGYSNEVLFSHPRDDHRVQERSSTSNFASNFQAAFEEWTENHFQTDKSLPKSREEILDELERAYSRSMRDIDDDKDDGETSDESARELMAPSDDEEIYGTRDGYGGWW